MRRLPWWLLGLPLLSACAGAVESTKQEDRARRAVPVAICIKPLERRSSAERVSTLTPQDYWSMILPSYDPASSTVDRTAPDCAGRPVFSSTELLDAEGPRTGPMPARPEDVVALPGPSGFTVLWLRTHRFANGEIGGPIALVRPKQGYAEVYATGVFRGSAEKPTFTVERLGPRILITAADDGCTKAKPGEACATNYTVYLMRAGQLQPAAQFAIDRVEYGSIPGVSGQVQYRLTANPVFQDKALRVVEQIVVRDNTQTVIRKSNLDRTFVLKNGNQLVANHPSLWERMTAQQAKEAPAQPLPPAVPPAAPPKPR